MALNLQLFLRPMSGGLKRHLNFVSSEVSQCLSSELFSDLVIVTLGGPIPCHLSVLAPLSPVLRMLLSAVPPCLGSVYTVVLPVEVEIVRNMIQIIYTGRVMLPSLARVEAVLTGLGMLGINLPGLEYYMPSTRTFTFVSRDEEQLSSARVKSMECSSLSPPTINHVLSPSSNIGFHQFQPDSQISTLLSSEEEFSTDMDEANENVSVFSPLVGSFSQQSTSNIKSNNTQTDIMPSTLLLHELKSTTMIGIMEQSSSYLPTKQSGTSFQQEAISVKEFQIQSAMSEEDVSRSCFPDPDIEPRNHDTLVRHLVDHRVNDQEYFHYKKCQKGVKSRKGLKIHRRTNKIGGNDISKSHAKKVVSSKVVDVISDSVHDVEDSKSKAVDVDATIYELLVAKGLDSAVASSDQDQANDQSEPDIRSSSRGCRVVTPSTYETVQDFHTRRGKKRPRLKSCRSNSNLIKEEEVSSLHKCPEPNCAKHFASSEGVKIHLALSHCEVGEQICFCRSLELEKIILTGYGETKCHMCNEMLQTEVSRDSVMEYAGRDSCGGDREAIDCRRTIGSPSMPNNVETPRYRVKEYRPSYILEGTENISDVAILKRHDKKEKEEKRRKRWDAQDVREQERVEKLRSRLNKKEKLKNKSEGSVSDIEITHIFISDELPSTQMKAEVVSEMNLTSTT